ncbi:MAG: Lrp/AsnC family transcriptional regulator [Pseudomonadales bacterium]|jgi:DNA-binding Lrp family transcriptional regulator|nr:Lrp/AsnC family transcriptional regulator [Pseudomonadales bacterium]MDP6472840.1 Lrp/AsnC family transcriptional regulator [Pseudomonadales bacterium]MDP6828056.1 Lrp/AsnC family transcriptional regulator [Pseudomonadales bacterium]
MSQTEADASLALDRYERLILVALQANARLTNQELASQVGLSPSACWRRVKALEDAGVILRYAAILDPKKIGVGECVFVHVSLTRHSRALSTEFADLMLAHPEVVECFFTTGEADILLRVVIPSVSAYDRFLENVIFSAPGVSQVHSNFALRQIKFETALPLQID